MKILRPFANAFCILAALGLAAGCAARKPKSSARVIMEGDANPYIREHAEHAGEHVRNEGDPR